MINELVIPILPVIGKISIITGKGSNNASGESVIKNTVFRYFNQLEIQCNVDQKNPGLLHIHYNSNQTFKS